MITPPEERQIAAALHYPECWDTAAYPTLAAALLEALAYFQCAGEGPHPDDKITMPRGV